MKMRLSGESEIEGLHVKFRASHCCLSCSAAYQVRGRSLMRMDTNTLVPAESPNVNGFD